MRGEMLILAIIMLLIALSLSSIVIIAIESRSIKFWQSKKQPWDKLWRIALWSAIFSACLAGVVKIVQQIMSDDSHVIVSTAVAFSVIAVLMITGLSMIFWIAIWNNRLDWWNAGKRWQRVLVGGSIALAIVMVIITGILAS